MRGVSFLWYRVRKFEPMYFLDWNREFQPLSIPASHEFGRYDWCTPCLNASQGGKDVHKLMVFQVHPISDMVEVDSVIQMVSEPRHQHFTNG
jgi:hypothetical protein